jgi:DNA gyrase subunit A
MATKDEDFLTRLFVANTHTPILFFSSRGIAYKEKVWRLPIGNPQSRGKFLRNMLPLEEGDRITAILPLPDESEWDKLDVVFSTTRGTVRRNKLSDFADVKRNGKIAMKFDEEGDSILAVETCTNDDDVLLTADSGQCIRFPVEDLRVFQSRSSQGVRGIQLSGVERAISMTILEHVDATPAERASYLKRSAAERRAAATDPSQVEEEVELTNEEVGEAADLSDERYAFMKEHEQFVLTVTEFGYGKRSSSYDFRHTNRGGKGIRVMDVGKIGEIGRLVAAFPVKDQDQIMMVSDGGTVIRIPVTNTERPEKSIRITSRASKGVTIFNTAEGEKVVSVERISEPQGEEAATEDVAGPEVPGPDGSG